MIRIWCRRPGWSRWSRWPSPAGLGELADQHLTVPTDKGANAGLKVTSLVAGMVAGADSIDDMALLRHGGMGRVFADAYAPSTLGSFLRAFSFGHVRQLDAVASRFLTGLAAAGPAGRRRRPTERAGAGRHRRHDHRGPRLRQAGLGLRLLRRPRTQRAARHRVHQRVGAGDRGPTAPEGIVRIPARRGPAGRRRLEDRPARWPQRTVVGAGRLGVLRPPNRRRRPPGRCRCLGHRAMDPKVKAAIASDRRRRLDADRVHRRGVRRADPDRGSPAPRSPRSASPHSPRRRRPSRSPDGSWSAGSPTSTPAGKHGQPTLFDTWRFHAFFTTTDPAAADTVAADKTHRGHAIIEQVHADLKHSALAHLPSGKFTANAAWLVLAVMAFNLTRAAAASDRPALWPRPPPRRSAAS